MKSMRSSVVALVGDLGGKVRHDRIWNEPHRHQDAQQHSQQIVEVVRIGIAPQMRFEGPARL